MHSEYLMGNEAVALGALAAGVDLVCGYPGTPSTEVLETVARLRPDHTYVEWSINEKTAMEIAAGGAYAGARVMVTMKQMGLNVAADPLMSLEYVGVKGGMVVLVADDPGPISSQTEQDTRHFAAFSKVPCFDPSTPQEAYDMVQEAFDFSERYGTPVFLRTTTRVSHGYAAIRVKEPADWRHVKPEGFVKDTARWVIFPSLSYRNHGKLEARNAALAETLSAYERNRIVPADTRCPAPRKGVAAGGIGFTYAMEAREALGGLPLLKISTPFPFPEEKAVEFLRGLDEVLCVEELDPVIEDALTRICGKHRLPVRVLGKRTGHFPPAGEYTRDGVLDAFRALLGVPVPAEEGSPEDLSAVPARPPVLCAGCSHRGAFYAVKRAMKGRKTIFCGDIGCYTLGNAMPLDMVDTCLCMGAGLGIAQGVGHIEPDTVCFAFVGDSTFFASAIPGMVNALYNQAEMILVVLDNATTAMTGHQPHPGSGRTMMGQTVPKISIEGILRGIGLTVVETVDPLDLKASIECVKRVAAEPGVRAIVFRSPCIALVKPDPAMTVDAEACTGCLRCVREIGCPALILEGETVRVDSAQCTGCALCAQLCPADAIVREGGTTHG